MRKLWKAIGVIIFWVTWPALFVYLYGSKRTRVIIRYDNQILVLRGWLGDGRWILPGGGLHRGEEPKHGAIREVEEEIALLLSPEALRLVYEGKVRVKNGLRYYAYVFVVDVPTRPELKIQKSEITSAEWVSVSKLAEHPELDALVTPALRNWKE